MTAPFQKARSSQEPSDREKDRLLDVIEELARMVGEIERRDKKDVKDKKRLSAA